MIPLLNHLNQYQLGSADGLSHSSQKSGDQDISDVGGKPLKSPSLQTQH